jgi:hypothetical protein
MAWFPTLRSLGDDVLLPLSSGFGRIFQLDVMQPSVAIQMSHSQQYYVHLQWFT